MTRTGEMRICSLIRVVILSAIGLALSCLRINHLCRASVSPGLCLWDADVKSDVQISSKRPFFANGSARSCIGHYSLSQLTTFKPFTREKWAVLFETSV